MLIKITRTVILCMCPCMTILPYFPKQRTRNVPPMIASSIQLNSNPKRLKPNRKCSAKRHIRTSNRSPSCHQPHPLASSGKHFLRNNHCDFSPNESQNPMKPLALSTRYAGSPSPCRVATGREPSAMGNSRQ